MQIVSFLSCLHTNFKFINNNTCLISGIIFFQNLPDTYESITGIVISFKGMNVKLQIEIGIEAIPLTEEMVEKLSTKSLEIVEIVMCNAIGIDYHVIGKSNINRNFIT